LLRPALEGERVVKAAALAELPDRALLAVAGLVLVRQRPGTASGVIFITLEDETGVANLVVWPGIFERYRRVVLGAQLILARGRLQREGVVIHLVTSRLEDKSPLLRQLSSVTELTEPALTAPLARADEVKRPSYERRGLEIRSRDFH
jgi:error-prone DNA polymerase